MSQNKAARKGTPDLSSSKRALLWFYLMPPIVWLVCIFLASTSMGAEEVTLRALIRLLKLLTPEQAGTLQAETFSKVNFLIRKCAHLSEYAVLALLVARAIQFGAMRLKFQAVIGGLLCCAAYAATDEFHQSFVPGRTASIHDVMIDCVGAFFALCLMSLWFALKTLEQRMWQNNDDTAQPLGSRQAMENERV